MISNTVIALSQWQVAIATSFHLLFLPLNIGLPLWLTAIKAYAIWRGQLVDKHWWDLWVRLFKLNFGLSVLARVLLLFSVGMHDSYLAHYVGDIWFLPTAIDALTSLFLALFLLKIFSNYQTHVWRLGLSLIFCSLLLVSAYWQFLACNWRFNPLGAAFDYQTYRMQLTDFGQMLRSISAQTLLQDFICSYWLAAGALIAVSARVLLKQATHYSARKTLRFGLVANVLLSLSCAVLLLTSPDQFSRVDNQASLQMHIGNGVAAYQTLQVLRDENRQAELLQDFAQKQSDLGYVWLLKRWTEHLDKISPAQIAQAAAVNLPVQGLSDALRVFATVLAAISTIVFSIVFYAVKNPSTTNGYLRLCVWLPLLAIFSVSSIWLSAESAISPWAVAGVLPNFLSVSVITLKDIALNLAFEILLMVLVLAAAVWLANQYIRTYIAQGVAS